MHPSTVKVGAALRTLGVAGQVTGERPAGRRCRTLGLCARS
jgi:hypothetical protein